MIWSGHRLPVHRRIRRPACIPNANGVASFSPGLARRRRGYPGNADERTTTLQGLNPRLRAGGCNPFRVDALSRTVTQGSSFLATPGWMMECRWRSFPRA